MQKTLTVVFCLFVAMAFMPFPTQAETVNWIVTADKTSVANNNADGVNFQITLLDANGSVDTPEAASNIFYRVYAYSAEGYVYGATGADGIKSDYLPAISGEFKDNIPSMDYGTYWVSGQTAAAEGHSAFIRSKSGLAGFNMWFKNTFTGTATITLKLEKITAPNSTGGVDIATLQTKTTTVAVNAGSSDVTKLRIEEFNKSASDTLSDSTSDTALPIADGKCQLGKISGSTVKIKLYKDTNYLTYSEPSSFTGTVYLTLTGFNPINPTMASGTIAISSNVADSDTVTINGIAFQFDNNSSVVETSSLRKVDVSAGMDKINAGNKLAQAINNCALTTGTYRSGDIYNEYIRAVSDNNGNVTIYSEGQSASAILLFKAESGAVISLPNNLSGGTASRVDAGFNNATGNTFIFSGTITNGSEGAVITLGDTDKDGKTCNKAGWYWMRAYVTVGSSSIYSEAGLDRLLVLPPDVSSGIKLSMTLDKNFVHKDTDQLDPLTETSSINTGWAYIDDVNGNHCRFNTNNTGNVPASITVPNSVTGINTVSLTIDKRAPRKSFNIPSSLAGINITTGAITLTMTDSSPSNALNSTTATMTVVDTGISARFLRGLKSSSTLNKNVLISGAVEIFKDDGDGLPGQTDATLILTSNATMTADKTVTIAGLIFTAKAVENTALGQFSQSVDAAAQAASLTRCINDYGRDPNQGKYLFATVSGTSVSIYYGGTGSGITATCDEASKWTFGTGADLVTTAGFTAGAADSALDNSSTMTLTMEWFQNYNLEGTLTATVPANQTSVDLIFSKAFYPNGISVKGGGKIWGNFVKFKVSTSSTTYGETIVPIYDANVTTANAIYTRAKANSIARTNNVNDNDTGLNAGSNGSGPGKGPGNSSGLAYWGSTTATAGWGVVSRISRGPATSVKYLNGLGEQVSMPTFNSVTENGNSVFYLINGADNLKNSSSGDRLWTNWNGYNTGNTNYSSWGIMTGYFAQFDINSEELYASTSENSQDQLSVASSRGATIGYYSDAANSGNSTPVAAGSNYFFVGKKNLGYYVKFTYASTDNGTQDTVTLTSGTPGATPLELRINVAQTRTLTSINATAARSSILQYDENIIRVEALDQYGKQIEPSGANAIYMTYDTSKGTIYNYARNATAPGAGGGVLQYTNSTFSQLNAYGTTPKPLMYFSYQANGTTGTAQITFEDPAKTITKKKGVAFTIVPGGGGDGDFPEPTISKYLPCIVVDNNWDAYIAVQNYGSREAKNVSASWYNDTSLYFTAYDKTGAVIGTIYKNVTIAANGMAILDAKTIFGVTPSDGTMMVKVTYNYTYSLKVMGIMTNKSSAEKNNFMLEDAVSASGQTLVVPEIIDSTNYKTTLVVGVAGTTSETVTVTGRDSSGTSYTKSETIAGNGFKAQDITSWFSSPSFAGKEGWVKATADNGPLIGAVIYTNATGARNTKGAISLSTVTRTGSLSAYVPMAVYSANFVTPQIYLANNSGSAVDVTVKAVKQDGTDYGTAKTTNVSANGQISASIDKSYFASTSDMPNYFTLKITSASTEVYAMVAYVFSTGYSKSSGDFVLATPLESSSTSSLNIPFYLTVSPYSNYLFVQNTGTASNSVTITAYRADGTSTGSTTRSIGANAMEFFVNDLAPNGYGAIKISGGSGILCTSVTAYGDGTKEIWGGFSVGN